MRRNFLTVGDKNPIMFNDMLCECARVEIGPQLGGWGGGGHLQTSASPLSGGFELHTHTYSRACTSLSSLSLFFKVDEVNFAVGAPTERLPACWWRRRGKCVSTRSPAAFKVQIYVVCFRGSCDRAFSMHTVSSTQQHG